MHGEIFDKTKCVAYFLWEYTQHDNALQHWYCAEDIACFFEEYNLIQVAHVQQIFRSGKYDYSYIYIVRNIAFRIYIYTKRTDSLSNWLQAEKLFANEEWRSAVTDIAAIYQNEKNNFEFVDALRSDKVRRFYHSNILD